jgi:hypothetical protein
MFYFDSSWALVMMQQIEDARKRSERLAWEYARLRGPMIEADINYCVPLPWRQMVDGDINA